MISAACTLLRFLYPTVPSLVSTPFPLDTYDIHSEYETGWISLRELAKPDLYHIRRYSIFPIGNHSHTLTNVNKSIKLR